MGDSKWEKSDPPCPGHFSLGRQDDDAAGRCANGQSEIDENQNKFEQITSLDVGQ
jgi:hypothetical protein